MERCPCAANRSGQRIDLASASGTFEGTDWSRAANGCRSTSSELHVGDFNGDGRDDMLCHDIDSGERWIDDANGSGQFTGTNWNEEMGWCADGANTQLFVADFNGDNRDDILCHGTADGQKWIAFANSSGEFDGTSREWAMQWCRATGSSFYAADFDGNGTSDFLCHSTENGLRWIAYQQP